MFTVLMLMVFGSLIGLLVSTAVLMDQSILQRRFRDLGVVAGRPLDDIIASVGRPNALTPLPQGGTVMEWRPFASRGFKVALGFDAAGVCQGEYRS